VGLGPAEAGQGDISPRVGTARTGLQLGRVGWGRLETRGAWLGQGLGAPGEGGCSPRGPGSGFAGFTQD